MLEAIVWPLVVVIIWAMLFIATLSVTRWAARDHDHEKTIDADQTQNLPVREDHTPAQAQATEQAETTEQPVTA